MELNPGAGGRKIIKVQTPGARSYELDLFLGFGLDPGSYLELGIWILVPRKPGVPAPLGSV